MLASLSIKSLLNRKASVVLIVMAMTVSIFVLLSVEHIRYHAKESFSKTVSGVDLIVGAKTSSLNLLLYSVFRTGAPSSNISWDAYQTIEKLPNVKWAIPMLLGDSHKGFRVLGTSTDYFKYFNYGQQRALSFTAGQAFSQLYDVVLGTDVANQLNYKLGDQLVVAHGIAQHSFTQHDDKPFTVAGVLAPTGTPVDQTLHVSLEAIEAIHDARPIVQKLVSPHGSASQVFYPPSSVTAIMLGLDPKMATFKVKRAIDSYEKEPLLAILPGATLSELWEMMAIVENVLRLISILVFVATLFGLSAMLLSSMQQRAKEIKLLRVVGASPRAIFALLQLEVFFITLLSIVLGVSVLAACLFFAGDFLVARFGLQISYNVLSVNNLLMLLAVLLAAMLVAVVPSLKALGYGFKSK